MAARTHAREASAHGDEERLVALACARALLSVANVRAPINGDVATAACAAAVGVLEPLRAPDIYRSDALLTQARTWHDEQPELFRQDFRLTPSVFDRLLQALNPTLEGAKQAVKCTPDVVLMLTLSRLGSRCTLRDVGERFGLSPSSAFNCFWFAVTAINTVLLPTYVHWPSPAGLQEIRQGFACFKLGGNIVGAIDCTHVSVCPPEDVADNYLDRTRGHSVIAQAVVDHRGLFTSVNAGYPGSAHDLTVLRASRLYKNIVGGLTVADGDVLLADSGYFVRPYLLTPFDLRGGPLTAEQIRYNTAHSRARGIVERAFGQLKQRYRTLLFGIEGDVFRAHHVVTACFALHNFGLLHGEPPWEIDEREANDVIARPPKPIQGSEDVQLAAGRTYRDMVLRKFSVARQITRNDRNRARTSRARRNSL